MATRFEKLDKHFDRLEKLFSRKKKGSELHASDIAISRPATPIQLPPGSDANTQTFPQPSFIRPTSSRMVAREEVLLTPHSGRRALSLPEPPSTPRLPSSVPSTNSPRLTGCEAPVNCLPIPARYSSVGSAIPQRSPLCYPDASRDDPSFEFLEYSFSTASKESRNDSSPRRRSRSSFKSLSRSANGSVSPRARGDRKRYSAGSQTKASVSQQLQGHVSQEAEQHVSPSSGQLPRGSRCLEVAAPGYLSPSLSPRPIPRRIYEPKKLDNDSGDLRRPKSLEIIERDIKHVGDYLRKSTSLGELPTAKVPRSDPILKEPSVTDFLALSDDDIADGNAGLRAQPTASKPPTFALPPNPSPAPSPVWTKPAYPLLTLSPPLASKPATSAAFEAARIAAKYHLDLVYVVNLWPSHMSRPSRSSPLSQFCGTPVATSPGRITIPSPPRSPVSNTSGYDSGFESRVPRDSPRGGVTGRLLAAYGLPSIMYPFRISAPVHQKVLRTQGWLEYRNESGAPDEFARGYSCSFYTGHSPARGREQKTDAAATTPDGRRKNRSNTNNKNRPPNRGIVFAAFRLPREDGTPVCSNAEELEALHRDAEALVDMLIDIHMAQRQTRAPATPVRCAARPNGGLVTPGLPLVSI